VSPITMSQRLVRVKTKIRDARIRFEVPGPSDLPARLGPVLEAIYAASGRGWEDVAGADGRREDLADEAIWLGRLVTRLLPDEPEAGGPPPPSLPTGAGPAGRPALGGRR